jgi:hypothetical protein
MKFLVVLCLFSSVYVEAQLATEASGSTRTRTQTQSSTIEALPSITPFQIPPGVLQGLGLPIIIPAMEQSARQPAAKGSRPANNAPWAAPSPQGILPGRQDYRYGTQGGLPYDRSNNFHVRDRLHTADHLQTRLSLLLIFRRLLERDTIAFTSVTTPISAGEMKAPTGQREVEGRQPLPPFRPESLSRYLPTQVFLQ